MQSTGRVQHRRVHRVLPIGFLGCSSTHPTITLNIQHSSLTAGQQSTDQGCRSLIFSGCQKLLRAMKQVAVKRLLQDLKEVLENPLEDAVALPLEADLFTWRGNVRISDGPLADVPIHFTLLFPHDYPTNGPDIRLFHALPHPNVVPARMAGGAAFRAAYWDCNPSISQWSPAYSVYSVLVQLQPFLLSPDLLYDTAKITHDRCKEAALTLKLADYPHQGTLPHPPFPTTEDIAIAPRLQRVEVVAPSINPELLVHLPNISNSATAAMADPEGWLEVGRKGVRPRAEHLEAAGIHPSLAWLAAATSKAATGPGGRYGLGGYSLMADPQWESIEEILQWRTPPPTISIAKASSSGSSSCGPSSAASPAPPKVPSIASAAPSITSSAAAKPGRRKPLLDDSILKQQHSGLIADVLKVWQRRREVERQASRAKLQVIAAEIRAVPDHRSADLGLATGSAWDVLDPDAMLQVLLCLEPRDVAALGTTCKALRDACRADELWRELLRRRFPASVLHAAELGGWRVAYALEANCVLPELRCFYSKVTFADEVLGMPFTFTTNPKTKRVDYIAPTCNDLLALPAHAAGLVTKDIDGNQFKGVLPLYICAEHWERAVPHLPGLLRQLVPLRAVGMLPGADLPPDAWLEVLPCALNTCAVLLCDRGVAASDRALNSFVALHRLLMAVCEHYQLWDVVDRRISRFLSSEAERSKAQTPTLGALLPLLALGRRHDWRDVLLVVLSESQDRSILWICKHDPSLERLLMRAPEAPADATLLRGAWEGSRVGRRLFQLHAAFLECVARPPGTTLGAVMHAIDSLYGRPGAGGRARFQASVKGILAANSWEAYYDTLGLVTPSQQRICASLRASCAASLRKGYHRAGMDFTRVQAGGVSTILLKGQSFTAPPGIKSIAVDERWHNRRRGSFTFLDASSIIYGNPAAIPAPLRSSWGGAARYDWAEGDSAGGRRGGSRQAAAVPTCPPVLPGGRPLELLGIVDYCTSHGGRVGQERAVLHSGDMIDGDSGQHTITLSLEKLGPQVQALFLTMSAWAGARLSHIDQPYISVQDPASGAELCQYFLEDLSPAQRQQHSAVIMCCIYRSPRAQSQWEVAAVGQVGLGEASNYNPLLRCIQALPPIHTWR